MLCVILNIYPPKWTDASKVEEKCTENKKKTRKKKASVLPMENLQ